MSWKQIKLVPCLLALGVIILIGFLQSLRFWTQGNDPFERLEWRTYDWRVKHAASLKPPVATNFAFLAITDKTIKAVKEQSLNLGQSYGLYWPRHIYGRVIRELNAQGAKAIAFDIMFADRREDLPKLVLPNGQQMDGDIFMMQQMYKGSNVIIASTPHLIAEADFRANALAVGDITADTDVDGILRRARPYNSLRVWDRDIIEMVKDSRGLNLEEAEIRSDTIIFRDASTNSYWLKLNSNGEYNLLTLTEDILPDYAEGVKETVLEEERWRKPYEDLHAWHMGVLMAAAEVGLDLSNAKIEPRQVFIPGTNGTDRTIPLDHRGYMYVDWSMPGTDERLLIEAMEWQILNDTDRERGVLPPPEELTKFKDKLVFIGSAATGSELTDRGATPLGLEQWLISKHWNIANSVIMDRVVVRSEFGAELLTIILLGILSAVISWWLQPPLSTGLVVLVGGAYVYYAFQTFADSRVWIPVFLPVMGAVLFNHASIVAYQVVFEGQERRRIKGVFAKLVSPNVVNELLSQQDIHLGGQRREITVFFSDVRGFTTMTDEMQKYADDFVVQHGLEGEEAERFRDEVAAETLETVNMYLATIADQIKKHNGTLDKYIGDCVMAFWGAPTPNEKHAVSCVRSTVDAQLAMYQLNVQRARENEEIELENERLIELGQPPRPLKRLLVMGSGVNTGTAIVGLMGSEDHIFNFTVFGREVNLASRLEHVSGRSRIIIGEATFRSLEQHDPELAQTCIEQPPVRVKGIEGDVRNWEVPWRIYLADQMNEGKLDPAMDPDAIAARKEREKVEKERAARLTAGKREHRKPHFPASEPAKELPATTAKEPVEASSEAKQALPKPKPEEKSAPSPDESSLELEKLKAKVAAQVSATVTLKRENWMKENVTDEAVKEVEDEPLTPAELAVKKEEALRLAAFLARKQFERSTLHISKDELEDGENPSSPEEEPGPDKTGN